MIPATHSESSHPQAAHGSIGFEPREVQIPLGPLFHCRRSKTPFRLTRLERHTSRRKGPPAPSRCRKPRTHARAADRISRRKGLRVAAPYRRTGRRLRGPPPPPVARRRPHGGGPAP